MADRREIDANIVAEMNVDTRLTTPREQQILLDSIQEEIRIPDGDASEKAVVLYNLPYIYDCIVNGKSIAYTLRTLGVTYDKWLDMIDECESIPKLMNNAKKERTERVKDALYNKTQDRYIMDNKVLSNGVTVAYMRYQQSDFNSIKYYLNNKAPEEYNDKQQIELSKNEIYVSIDEGEEEKE